MNRYILSDRLRARRIRRYLRDYNGNLARLGTESIPRARASRLEVMALIADAVSAAEFDDTASEAWCVTAGILRSVAATERFSVLTDHYPYDDGDPAGITGPEHRGLWEELAIAAAEGDRRTRALVLGELCAAAAAGDGIPPGILVLDDIARTELAVAS